VFCNSLDISNTLADLDEELLSDSRLSGESKRGMHELGETLDTHSWGDLVRIEPHFENEDTYVEMY